MKKIFVVKESFFDINDYGTSIKDTIRTYHATLEGAKKKIADNIKKDLEKATSEEDKDLIQRNLLTEEEGYPEELYSYSQIELLD